MQNRRKIFEYLVFSDTFGIDIVENFDIFGRKSRKVNRKIRKIENSDETFRFSILYI